MASPDDARGAGQPAPLLQTRGLGRVFTSGGDRIAALQDVTMSVGQGEYVAVLGESGSGKTTLLNLLGAIDRPTSGSIRFRGRALEAEPETELVRLRRRSIGFVFQDFCLVDNLSVLANVTLPLLFNRSLDRRDRAVSLLERFGLASRAHRPVRTLSRGEMQRVALARALVAGPCLLLGDEPTGNLDARNGAVIMEHVRDLNRSDRLTVVVATHSDRLAAEAGRVVLLDKGRLRAPSA